MYHQHVKKIKVHFTIILMSVIALIITSTLFLRPIVHASGLNLSLGKRYLGTQIDYLAYERAVEKRGVISRVLESFHGTDTVSSDTHAESLPVLVYHGVVDEPDGSNVTEEQFAKQMIALKHAGYETVRIEDAAAFMKGEKALPAKSFLLTFDDGRKDSYYPVDPVLKALGYTAVMFVITGESVTNEKDNGYYLSLAELQQMKKNGRWDIEAHAAHGHHTHVIDSTGTQKPFLASRMWTEEAGTETMEQYQERVIEELEGAKHALQAVLGRETIGFAFPFGSYGQEQGTEEGLEKIVLASTAANYPLAFRQVRSGDYFEQNYPAVSPQSFFLMKRIEVSSEITPESLLNRLEASQAKTLPYQDLFDTDKGWRGGWGGATVENGYLNVGATESTTGGLTILDGGYDWSNYRAEATVTFSAGQVFGIIGAYQDGENYFTCRMSDHGMVLEERRNGARQDIRTWRGTFHVFRQQPVRVGIEVSDQRVACFLGDRVVVTAPTTRDAARGSVGFMTWNESLMQSKILVDDLSVVSLRE